MNAELLIALGAVFFTAIAALVTWIEGLENPTDESELFDLYNDKENK